MFDRRTFLLRSCAITLLASGTGSTFAAPTPSLPRRPIPGTQDSLPIIGLGNSNAFRAGDAATTAQLLRLFHGQGGAYVDCMGESRFVVANAARQLGIGGDLFLGTYFTGEDEAGMRDNIKRLLEITGKQQLDLVHAYPEYAAPNWDMFRRWKDEGLTRYIGVARHNERYYEQMMQMIQTGTVDVLQVNYSPLETSAEERILPLALDQGVAVTINRPFINGSYFRRVRGHTLPAWAADFDCASWAQFSLKFILSHPAVTCVLTETANPEHALDNIGAGFGRLPDAATRKRIVDTLQALPDAG